MRRIRKIQREEDFRLRLIYDDGSVAVVDFKDLIDKEGIFTSLKEPKIFSDVRLVEGGHCIQWPNELTLSADALWMDAFGA